MRQQFTGIVMAFCAAVLLVMPVHAQVEGPIVGASATVSVVDFPEHGYTATAEWNEDAQAFTLVALRTPDDAALDGTLLAAAAGASTEAVQMALDNGASVHARGASSETVLFFVTQAGVAQLLIDAGASVDARNNYGMTPLHEQVIRGRIAIARLLLEAGADVNARDERGWTPLQWVENPPWGVTQASEDMVTLLKDAGAM